MTSQRNAHGFSPAQTVAYWFVHLGFYLLSCLPLSVLQLFGKVIGLAYYRGARKRVNIARVNLKICYPELDFQQRETIVKNSILSAAIWFFEAGPLWLWPAEKILKNVTVNNLELFENALSSKQGILLAVPHMGNWEVMGPFISQYSTFACFYKNDPKHPLMSEFVRRQRSRHDIVMAPNDASGVRILYKHIRAGKVAGLLPDHKPTDDMGVFAPFFGREAFTGTLVSALARKNSAHVIAATVLRRKKGFEIFFFRVPNQHSDDKVLAATSINRAMEDCINLDPGQFQWVYPRFRKRRDHLTVPSPYRVILSE